MKSDYKTENERTDVIASNSTPWSWSFLSSQKSLS